MKKPLRKLRRYDDVFNFFLKRSFLSLLMAAMLALVLGQRLLGGAAIFLLLLVIGGTDGWLALLRRKPKVFPRCGARPQPKLDGYAESDALLTEMKIPYYEYRAANAAQTTNPAPDAKSFQLQP